ncbi:MAG: CpXC domain-containing protein [Lactimicrobium sp.]|jgi:hypothetical protein|uniref:CpXC domain-containing protein n=1 Tax=Lactimicrobium sp. TaxID=2563780 RepID=UPI002F352BA3
MTAYKVDRIACPVCGKSIKVKRYPAFDSAKQSVREKIFQGMFFHVRCPFCKTDSEIPYSTVYHELSQDKFIAYAADDAAYQKFVKEAEEEGIDRIVRDTRSFSEKALIFDSGYDDRIIEIFKKLMFDLHHKEHPEYLGYLFNVGVCEDGSESDGLFPYTTEGIVEAQALAFNRLKIEQLENEFDIYIDNYPGSCLEVDQNWAQNLLKFAQEHQDLVLEDEIPLDELDDTDAVNAFVDKLYELEGNLYDDSAAAYLKKNFDKIWAIIRKHAKKDENDKLLFDIEEDPYDEYVPNWLEELDMILNNARAYDYSRKLSELQLKEINLDGERLAYHNLKRNILECIYYSEGMDAAKQYLQQWQKEEPGSAYVAASEVDLYLINHDLEKAEKLADRYLSMPMKESGDSWLYDSCENVYRECRQDAKVRQAEILRKSSSIV